jgi:nickel-dependent lactate racemase
MEYSFRYGKGEQRFDFPEEDVIRVVNPSEVEIEDSTDEEKVLEAIEHPIGSPKLEEIIRPGETVCIIVPDTTRLWQHPDVMCRVLVKKLEDIGVEDKDMLIISALGTHRKQTEEEMRAIVSDEVFDKIKMEDHDCDHNLVEVGKTSDGNTVELNATAMSYDHRILIGGVVFHFLAGFGGGRKTILPGISSRKTIMYNHSHYFNPGGLGSGRDMNVSCGGTYCRQ